MVYNIGEKIKNNGFSTILIMCAIRTIEHLSVKDLMCLCYLSDRYRFLHSQETEPIDIDNEYIHTEVGPVSIEVLHTIGYLVSIEAITLDASGKINRGVRSMGASKIDELRTPLFPGEPASIEEFIINLLNRYRSVNLRESLQKKVLLLPEMESTSIGEVIAFSMEKAILSLQELEPVFFDHELPNLSFEQILALK